MTIEDALAVALYYASLEQASMTPAERRLADEAENIVARHAQDIIGKRLAGSL